MTLKIINNTGNSADVMVYDQETADRLVPGGLPVTSIVVVMRSGEPVKAYFEMDFLQLDVSGVSQAGVRMRIPGTQEVADVAEIRYKDGRVYRCA